MLKILGKMVILKNMKKVAIVMKVILSTVCTMDKESLLKLILECIMKDNGHMVYKRDMVNI